VRLYFKLPKRTDRKTNYPKYKNIQFVRKISLSKESVKRFRVTIGNIEVMANGRKIIYGIFEDIKKDF